MPLLDEGHLRMCDDTEDYQGFDEDYREEPDVDWIGLVDYGVADLDLRDARRL